MRIFTTRANEHAIANCNDNDGGVCVCACVLVLFLGGRDDDLLRKYTHTPI